MPLLARRSSIFHARGLVPWTLLSLLFAATASQSAPVTSQEKNVVSALYTFDSILGFTALDFGVDPGEPMFPMSGTVSDSGFSWTVAANFHGRAFSYSASGAFDSGSGVTTWTGAGRYGSVSLTASGTTAWTNDIDFAIKDSISVDGVPTLWSINGSGQPDANVGTMEINGDPVSVGGLHVRDDWITIHELGTRHWYSFITGPVTDGWVVRVSDDGKISTNVYGLAKEGTSVGVQVGLTPLPAGGGMIDFGGQTVTKVGFVTSVPEPATLAMLLGGFLAFGIARGLSRPKELWGVFR